jgi:hypothetical protein
MREPGLTGLKARAAPMRDYTPREFQPRKTTAMERALAGPEHGTPLQLVMRQHCRTLARARRLNDRDRAAFADIGLRMFTRALGPELVVLEADEITRKAA